MFRSARAQSVPPSFIGTGLRIEGDIKSEGDVDIAGVVNGNVTARKITVFAGAALNGVTKVETAVINGALDGHLTAADVSLGSKAHVAADITYVSLQMEAGAVFVGQSRRVESLDTIPADQKSLPAPKAPAAESAAHAKSSLLHHAPTGQPG